MTKNLRTDIHALLRGAARIADVFRSLRPEAKAGPPEILDREALRSDWEAVGQHLTSAMEHADQRIADDEAKQQPLFPPRRSASAVS